MIDPAQSRPRSSGIYGLFNLDGAPVTADDALALGMSIAAPAASWITEGHDANLPNSVSRYEGPGGLTILVGEVEEADVMADRLGIGRDAPMALLGQSALQRFQDELPAVLIGEWSLLHYEPGGALTLMLSAAQRDRLFYAVRGNRIAVAPNIASLGRLGWVDKAIDESGLLFSLGRAKIRAGRGDSSLLRDVRQLQPGCGISFHRDGGIVRHYARILDEQPRWQGSYDDAVDETRLLLQRILQDRTNRAGRVAPLVSGGLDSSLLASTYSDGRGTNAVALTSVAPPGSGIADESFFADSVCSTLGLERRNVYPAFDADTYRPAVHILEGSNGPLISNRHCLTEAFQAAAREAGANLMINGTYGELSVTARLPAAGLINRLRATLSRNRRRFSPDDVGANNGFHVRLAPHRLSQLPEDVQSALHAKQNLAGRQNTGGLFGYLRGADKALTLPNEFHAGAIRMDYPYRDLRLLRLFAGFPLKMLINGGHDRGMARALLAGRLPDSIRLRRRGMPASPDHMLRLQRQAGSARQRIAYFRKADIDDWLDLDWLDSALQAVAARGPANVNEANEVQLTVMAAEFLLWWRNRL